jgi:hypothetical protein
MRHWAPMPTTAIVLTLAVLAACGGDNNDVAPTAVLSATPLTAGPAPAAPATPAAAAPSASAPASPPAAAPAAPPAAAPAAPAASAPAAPNFRILPYLQQPSSQGMLLTWFTGRNQPGRLEITGPGLSAPLVLTSTPELRPEMAYTDQERAEDIAGLTKGSWLWAGQAYKHAVRVTGLQPGSLYAYTLQQGGETLTRSFRTAPTATGWTSLRFIAMSDSETEPRGRVTYREWAPGADADQRPAATSASASTWAQRFGTASLGGSSVLRYALTETEGFTQNLKIVDSRSPDFLLMPGDLVQGSGYQPGWDEFFRHAAGEFGDTLTRIPLIAAYGNWETFAAASGGYGSAADRAPVVRARHRFKTFIEGPDNGTPAHRTNYHRSDFGPVTIITLDSTKGAPDDTAANYSAAQKLTGTQYTVPGSDTQSSFRADEYAQAAQRLGLTNDLSPYNEGGVQWRWAEAQLADARANGRIVFVQFHHAPYSDGEHGLPMNHAQTSGQGGTPMRAYHPLFERYGVVAVLSGHSEMFERSFVDEDGDGVGVHYYDVGVAGDGLRGERRTSNGFTEGAGGNRLQYNPFSRWSADENEPERWSVLGGVLQLIDGGKHYGHLEVQIDRVTGDPAVAARVRFTPVYSFPLLDNEYRFVSTVRRVYTDGLTLNLDSSGRVRR